MRELVSEPEHAQPDVPGESFIRSFTQAQRALYIFILPLVGNSADADEVLQEANVVIWAKWKQFEEGTNFLAWARAIARLEVFRFRRSRHHKLAILEEGILEQVVRKAEEISDQTELRQAALEKCLQKLRPKDRDLIRMRYAPGSNGDKVARKLGRPPNSVYQSLGRIRRALLECIRSRLADAGGLS